MTEHADKPFVLGVITTEAAQRLAQANAAVPTKEQIEDRKAQLGLTQVAPQIVAPTIVPVEKPVNPVIKAIKSLLRL